MNRGIALLAAAALFASGLAVGALGVHLFYAQKIGARSAPPMPVGAMFGHWVERELDLSPGQLEQVREILERGRREAEAIRRDLRPRLMSINRSTAEAIAEVLEPDQRARFETLMEERRRHERRFGDRPPFSGRRGPRWRQGPPRRTPPPSRPTDPPAEAPPDETEGGT